MTQDQGPQYRADLVVSAELAHELIAKQFPRLRDANIVAFGEGWDNWIYRADNWLFRFPRRRIAVPLAEREMTVLPHLAPRLPVPIPHPVLFGQPTPQYPCPFFGYQPVPGTAVAEMQSLDPTRRCALAGALAEFLRALQTVPVTEASAWGMAEATLGRMDLGQAKERFELWMASAVDRGIAHPDAPWATEFREANVAPLPLDHPVLVHGDLNFKNVLLDPDGQLAGVVDWGDLHLGHWAEDWMFAAGYLPRSGQEAFRAGVGAADERLWQTARALSIYVNLIILVSASDMGYPKDVAEAQWQLANLAATQQS